jgi:hypothetical protein
MGLLKGIVLLPLAPVRGVVWVAERLAEHAEHELYGVESIRRQLGELGLALELGEIDQEQYEAEEAGLLDRLAAARADSGGEHERHQRA